MNAKQFVAQANKLADDESLIEDERRLLIKFRGWELSCDYPDCRWRWRKKFDAKGPIITESSIESALDTELSILQIRNPNAWPKSEAY